jgi:hypothetical protein
MANQTHSEDMPAQKSLGFGSVAAADFISCHFITVTLDNASGTGEES